MDILKATLKRDFNDLAKIITPDSENRMLYADYLNSLASNFELYGKWKRFMFRNPQIAHEYLKTVNDYYVIPAGEKLKGTASFNRQLCSAISYENFEDIDIPQSTRLTYEQIVELTQTFLNYALPECSDVFKKIVDNDHIFVSPYFKGIVYHPSEEKDYFVINIYMNSFFAVYQLVTLFGQFVQETMVSTDIKTRFNYHTSYFGLTIPYVFNFIFLDMFEKTFKDDVKTLRKLNLIGVQNVANKYLGSLKKGNELTLDDIPGAKYFRSKSIIPRDVTIDDPYISAKLHYNITILLEKLRSVYSFLLARVLMDKKNISNKMRILSENMGLVDDETLLELLDIQESDLVHKSLNLKL